MFFFVTDTFPIILGWAGEAREAHAFLLIHIIRIASIIPACEGRERCGRERAGEGAGMERGSEESEKNLSHDSTSSDATLA